MPAILFVLTSVSTTLIGAPTGWYLPEAAHPYYVLAPHATIEFASPKGANPPLDPASVKAFESDAECVKFLADETVKSKLASTKKLSEVSSKDYDVIFYVGGHGPTMICPLTRIASGLQRSALVNVKDAQGKSIFAGKAATGFSNEEEIMMDKVKDVPFLLEDRIISLGGKYEKAAEAYGLNSSGPRRRRRNLYTGQNPASAGPIAEAILKAMKL
ncbi:ThiJ/PfpI [Mycena galopus ATCC 62051]|nr:ThiJ/PfpI [Mycena galopus ATCC 62051]